MDVASISGRSSSVPLKEVKFLLTFHAFQFSQGSLSRLPRSWYSLTIGSNEHNPYKTTLKNLTSVRDNYIMIRNERLYHILLTRLEIATRRCKGNINVTDLQVFLKYQIWRGWNPILKHQIAGIWIPPGRSRSNASPKPWSESIEKRWAQPKLKREKVDLSKVCLSFVLFPFLGKFNGSVVSVLGAQVFNAQIPALTKVISNDNVNDDGEK